MSPATVHVLLVHYNTPELIDDCIRSVLVSAQAQVHVLDNASRPELWQPVVAGWEGEPRVHLRRSDVNLGFGGGVNTLAEGLPEEDVLWVLNPDTVVETGALQALQDCLASGALDVVSPVLTTGPADDRTIWFAAGDVNSAGRVWHHHYGRPVADVPRPPVRPSSFLTGAAPMMTVRTWLDVGGFRDELFLYWEDVEWCLRATAAGKRLGVVGDAEVWHAVGRASASSGKAPHFYYYNVRNRILSIGGATVPSRARFAAVHVREELRALVRGLREPGRRLPSAAMVLRGLVDGVRGVTGPLT